MSFLTEERKQQIIDEQPKTSGLVFEEENPQDVPNRCRHAVWRPDDAS